MFRASYGDADPRRLTDVKVRLFQLLRQVAKQALTTIAHTRKRSYLPWSRDPKRGLLRRVLPLVSADWYVSLRLTGLTSGELGPIRTSRERASWSTLRNELGLGVSARAPCCLRVWPTGLARTPGPPDLKLDIYLAGLATDRRVNQGALLMALAGDQEVSELAV